MDQTLKRTYPRKVRHRLLEVVPHREVLVAGHKRMPNDKQHEQHSSNDYVQAERSVVVLAVVAEEAPVGQLLEVVAVLAEEASAADVAAEASAADVAEEVALVAPEVAAVAEVAKLAECWAGIFCSQ